MCYMFSFVSHAQHFQLVIESVQEIECKLCQNNIDTPQALPLNTSANTLITELGVGHYAHITTANYAFVYPSLRAPPTLF